MNKKENLNDYYLELLEWLQYEGKPSERIWHPLFYTYPWGLRFELGDPSQKDRECYIRSATERGERIWEEVFAPTDEVLVIFDTTPEKELKQELKYCQTQRLRAKSMPILPGEDEEFEERFFYRYLYAAPAREIPFDLILSKIAEGEMLAGAKVYSSSVYFYNRTKKLLFHPYDDRGADLIGPDRESLRPYYRSLNELLLDWNREDMDRKWKVRRITLRVLTTTMAPGTEEKLRRALQQRFYGMELTCSALAPYWKTEGWGEMNVTMETALSLDAIRRKLADRWESGTARDGIRLPNVGFLWLSE